MPVLPAGASRAYRERPQLYVVVPPFACARAGVRILLALCVVYAPCSEIRGGVRIRHETVFLCARWKEGCQNSPRRCLMKERFFFAVGSSH